MRDFFFEGKTFGEFPTAQRKYIKQGEFETYRARNKKKVGRRKAEREKLESNRAINKKKVGK